MELPSPSHFIVLRIWLTKEVGATALRCLAFAAFTRSSLTVHPLPKDLVLSVLPLSVTGNDRGKHH